MPSRVRLSTSRVAVLIGAVLLLVPVSAQAASMSTADLNTECVQAGRVLPQPTYAYMVHPGHRPYEHNPRKVGVLQTVAVGGRYAAMPEACADHYRRLGRVKVEIQLHKHSWRNMSGGRYWTVIYSRNREGNGGISLTPTGHESDWYYWKPGERVRAKVGNVVKNLETGETFTGTTKTVPVQIRGRRSKRRSSRKALRPRLTWTLPPSASEGQAIPFSWKATGRLGHKYRLVVQRPVGTARTWQTMLRLRTRKGSAELPGQKLGTYRFRLAVLRGHRVLTQQVAGIGVFGQVPFSMLLRNGYLTTGQLENGVYATPSSSFPYVGGAYVGDHGRPNTVFSVSHNRCSAVHVGFVLGESPGEEYSYPSAIYGVVSLVQQSRDPVASEVPLNGIGSVDAELVPGQTWSLLVEENNRDGKLGSPTVYFNGYAICDSTESFFS